MKVFYDGLAYIFHQRGGISRYFTNLITRLPPDWLPLLAVSNTSEMSLPAHPELSVLTKRELDFRPRRLAHWFANKNARSLVKRNTFDVAHPTYYWHLMGTTLSDYRCPTVITVYDMIHELFHETIDPNRQVAAAKKNAVQNADAVICISQHTKQDLLDQYSVPAEKISVTPLATEFKYAMAFGAEPIPDEPYFLYVGGRAGYKNFERLLTAFAKVASNKVSLCVVGTPFTSAEQQCINSMGLSSLVKNYGLVEDKHLAKLYRCSLAFVYPSLYEGFGIPLLEAMACGAPIIASERASIPEVVGDAGILFDPDDPNVLEDILKYFCDGCVNRELYLSKGRSRVKNFSWKKTTAETISVYQKLC